MGDFNEAGIELVVSDHAAKRWVDRAGGTIQQAKKAIANGIRNEGKLVMQQAKHSFYVWCGLVFPCIPDYHWQTGNRILVVKSTLLWGMAGGKDGVSPS